MAVLGDVGGHLAALRAELTRLGVPDGGDGPIPADLTVVQVGDLVHRGPESDAVVALVDRHLSATPRRWLQVVGNHEAFYLRRRQFSWHTPIARQAARTLRRWWRGRLMVPAVAIESGGESFLITHAGVTRNFWVEVLGSPASAATAAQRLNALARTRPRALFRPGAAMMWRRPTPLAGPIWALATAELLPSWLDHPLPFSQVYGHSSLVDWRTGELRVADLVGDEQVRLDQRAKHVSVTLPGGRLVGVDPGDESLAVDAWHAFVL